jgi:hypothetical protein
MPDETAISRVTYADDDRRIFSLAYASGAVSLEPGREV